MKLFDKIKSHLSFKDEALVTALNAEKRDAATERKLREEAAEFIYKFSDAMLVSNASKTSVQLIADKEKLESADISAVYLSRTPAEKTAYTVTKVAVITAIVCVAAAFIGAGVAIAAGAGTVAAATGSTVFFNGAMAFMASASVGMLAMFPEINRTIRTRNLAEAKSNVDHLIAVVQKQEQGAAERLGKIGINTAVLSNGFNAANNAPASLTAVYSTGQKNDVRPDPAI